MDTKKPQLWDFYPRPPRGGRRKGIIDFSPAQPDFYPRPPRGGRHAVDRHFAVPVLVISIHALREEGDCLPGCRVRLARLFLSTPSARRATMIAAFYAPYLCHFYPRPPRGGRRWTRSWSGKAPSAFLSTPSARRATASVAAPQRSTPDFYPRPPRGGRPRPTTP